MALIPKEGKDHRIEILIRLQIGFSKQIKKLNQKIPCIESESRVQMSGTQLAQTFGDKII